MMVDYVIYGDNDEKEMEKCEMRGMRYICILDPNLNKWNGKIERNEESRRFI
jgi:hypothetical protein